MAEATKSKTGLRLLHVFDQYSCGGFENHLDTLIKHLHAGGHRVVCAGGPDFSRSPASGLVAATAGVDVSSRTAGALKEAVSTLTTLIESHSVDVVHAHPYFSIVPAALASAATGRPMILTLHGKPDADALVEYLGLFDFQLIGAFALPYCSSLTVVSEAGLAAAAAAFGLARERLSLIPNPVDVEEFRPLTPPPRKRALLVSRLDRDKRVSCRAALELFQALRQLEPDWEFAVAGGGEVERELHDYAATLGLPDIDWVGRTVGVNTLMMESGLIIGLGRVVLEGLASGRLTVLAGNCGLAGLVRTDNFDSFRLSNFTAEEADPVPASDLARTIIESLEEQSRITGPLRELVAKRFGARNIGAAYERHYQVAFRSEPQPAGRARALEMIGWLEQHASSNLRELNWLTQAPGPPQWLFGSTFHGAALRRLRIDTLSEESLHYIALQKVKDAEVQALTGKINTLVQERNTAQAGMEGLAVQVDELQRSLKRQEAAALAGQARSDEESARMRQLIAQLESERESQIRELASIRQELAATAALHQQESEAVGRLAQELDSRTAELERLRTAQEETSAALDQATAESGALRRQIAALREEVAGLKSRAARLKSEAQSVRAESARAWAQNQISLERLRTLEQEAQDQRTSWANEIASLKRQNAEVKEQASLLLAESRAKLEVAEKELLALRRQKDELTKLASVQRSALCSLQTGVSAFRSQFEDRLAEYRGQRAWKAMLSIRLAYSLLLRGGWKGRTEFLSWLLRLPSRRRSVDEQELSFPNIRDFVSSSALLSLSEQAPSADSPALGPDRAGKYDLVILPIFDYEFRFQRPQQLAAEYAKAGHRVFWISPTRVLPAESQASFEAIPLRHNLWEVRLRRSPFSLYSDDFTPELASQVMTGLEELWKEHAIAESAVLLQFPAWRRAGLALRERFHSILAYDCMDDWQNWPTDPKPSPFSTSEERLLVAECDVLIVTATQFVERYKNNIPPPLLIPNGADFEFFSAEAKRPRELGRLPRPVVGYYGAISQWFDVELMTETARRRPQYSFVLIGQVHDRDVSKLRELPNVHLLGEKHYTELPAYLSGFDVCLIPFMVNDLTDAVDPVKIYEYFSQGKPVVATRLPELLKRGDLLYFGGEPDEFVSMVDHALQERDEDLKHRRIDYARRNQWRNRYEALDEAMAGKFPLVSIVVVTYNSAEYLAPFVESIYRNTTYPQIEVIIWDNASTDNSRDVLNYLAEKYPSLKLRFSDINFGFAGGNNRAVSEATGEYIVVINPDTLVTPGWVDRLLRPLRGNPKVGASAPVTNFSGNETRIDTGYRNRTEMERFASQLARENFGGTMNLDCAPLLCVFLRRSLWEELGGLDERYEVGMFEDDDFCLRIRNAGYEIVTAEDCFIHHFGNGSFGKLPSRQSEALFSENRKRFEEKWGVTWKPHASRPGVRPLSGAERIPVALFLEGQAAHPAGAEVPIPQILKLYPEFAHAGQRVNEQPDGASALVIECSNATPATMILWGGTPLTTTFGSDKLMSGVLPEGFSKRPGEVEVRLANDFGVSNPVVFTVLPK